MFKGTFITQEILKEGRHQKIMEHYRRGLEWLGGSERLLITDFLEEGKHISYILDYEKSRLHKIVIIM